MTSVAVWTAYVVGVVPAGTPVPAADDAEPLTDLRLVENGAIAALVGTPPADRPLGRAADLFAHDRLLAQLVEAQVPVLPMRFGTVLPDDAAVAAELLTEDGLTDQLAYVTGRVQYTVKARYEEDAVLREVLDEHPEIRSLRSTTGRHSKEALDRNIRLGQLVVQAIEQRRPADADEVLRGLGDQVATHAHEPSGPEEVLSAAFLVERKRAAAFERRAESVAAHHAGRLRLRLLGPSPAYDFVGGA